MKLTTRTTTTTESEIEVNIGDTFKTADNLTFYKIYSEEKAIIVGLDYPKKIRQTSINDISNDAAQPCSPAEFQTAFQNVIAELCTLAEVLPNLPETTEILNTATS